MVTPWAIESVIATTGGPVSGHRGRVWGMATSGFGVIVGMAQLPRPVFRHF